MPYIPKQERTALDDGAGPTKAGDLAYLIYTDCLNLLYRLAVHERDFKFADLSAVLGAVEAAKLEFYRRVVTPYEDRKIAENGDV